MKTSHFFLGHCYFSSPVLQNVSHLKLNEFLLVQPSNSIILSVSISQSVITIEIEEKICSGRKYDITEDLLKYNELS